MCFLQMALLEYLGFWIIEQLSTEESPNTAAANNMMTSICMLIGISGNAEIAPATKSKESPGRKGVTTNPVSQKIIMNKIA